MNFKKIMTVTFILLTILMIGAVSANENAENQTLTADEIQQSVAISLDDNNQNLSLNQPDKDNSNVLGRNATSQDFSPSVNDTIKDYHSSFINLTIPDFIDDGEIITTFKFNNTQGLNISNMTVNTDFNNQIVYKFDINEIKSNYGNNFSLSLSDLGFYEYAKYDIDVKFTRDGLNYLNITNATLNVNLSQDIIISIDKTSRYILSLPFANVRLFNAVDAYAELYIDDKIYSNKTFEKGLIIFNSSPLWTFGIHKAEIIVYDAKLKSVLNSTNITFETSIKSEDVNLTSKYNYEGNKNVTMTINVPKAGELFVQVDEDDGESYNLIQGDNDIDLGLLFFGNHTVRMLYNETLDGGNLSFYNNVFSIFVGNITHKIFVPNPIIVNVNDTIKFNLGEGSKGSILVYLDMKFIRNLTLVNGYAEINLTSIGYVKWGEHNYTFIYFDDGEIQWFKMGNLLITYLFTDNLNSSFTLNEFYDIVVILPSNAKGSVNLTVEGRTYQSEIKDGQSLIRVENITMGEHEVVITYSGHNYYPKSTRKAILNVSRASVVGYLEDGMHVISLMLEKNATGNLIVYDNNRRKILCSQALIGGKAKIYLNNLSVGIYEINAYYDGDDYEVGSYNDTFRVMPKVNISQNVYMGDNVSIFMDLDNAEGKILISIDGLSPVLLDITDGIINYTFSTEGYIYGNHTVNFLYFGNSFDGFIFFDDDYKTQINYDLSILPRPTHCEGQSNNDTYINIDVCDYLGNIAYDTVGNITFYINGIEYEVIGVVNGGVRLDISNFKDGKYIISWSYSGDSKYEASSSELSVDIFHTYSRLVAKDMSMIYTSNKAYSVTVYRSDGTLAGGVKVTFLVNNKLFKSVNTNSKGVASVVISKNVGSYKISACVLDLKVTKTLKVTHLISLKKVKIKKSAKKLVLKATLKKINGKYLRGKKITFKFKGKKYKAKTNKKGIAKVTIKKKVLKKLKVGRKVKYQAIYKKDKVKRSAKVRK